MIFYFRIKRDISMMEMYVVLLLKNFINNTKYTSSTGIDIILCSILRENIEDYPTMYHVAVKVIRNCIRALDFPTKMVCTMTSVVWCCNVVLQHLRVRLFSRWWSYLGRFILRVYYILLSQSFSKFYYDKVYCCTPFSIPGPCNLSVRLCTALTEVLGLRLAGPIVHFITYVFLPQPLIR